MLPNAKTEVKVVSADQRFGRAEVMVNELERVTPEANLAFVFLEKWGMVAAQEDGEDAAGRQRLRLLAPEDVVDRAFTIARLALERARRDGLIVLMPTIAEQDAVTKAANEAREAKKNKQPA